MTKSQPLSGAGRHVVLFGGFGYGNTGNDATLAVTMEALRARLPGVRFTVVAPAPDKIEARYGVAAAPIRPAPRGQGGGPAGKLTRELDRWRQARALLAGADCLLIPGTGIFDDFNTTTLEYAYPLLKWCSAAHSLRVPVKFVSVGAGPVERAWSKRLFRRAATLADHRSYRDEASKAFMRDALRVDVSRDAVTPDLVFGLAVPAPPLRAGPPQIVGIGAIAYHTWRGEEGGADDIYPAYMEKLSAFCSRLLQEGKALRILTGDPGDAEAIADLHARLARIAPAGAVSVARIETLEDMCAAVAETDIVVASRYHTIVAALLTGRPAVSIGYAVKNAEVMQAFGLGGFCQNILDFDGETLRRHFDEAGADNAAISARLRATAARMRGEVEAHFDRVAAEIARPARRRHVAG